MQVGCYTLNLYCDYKAHVPKFNEFPREYTDELGVRCRKAAKRAGWILSFDGTATCPKCAPSLRREWKQNWWDKHGNAWRNKRENRSEEHTSELQSRQYLVC